MHEKSLSEAMKRTIREFCSHITEGYNVDDDTCEELYGHIEDRMLDYLSGEEPLTEEDAFVLVREHFGEPIRVRELLGDVHGVKKRTLLVRKMTPSLVFITHGTGVL